MGYLTITQIRSFFETGDRPTEEEFLDVWDSFWHKFESTAVDFWQNNEPWENTDPLQVKIKKLVNGTVQEFNFPVFVPQSRFAVFKSGNDNTQLIAGDVVQGFMGAPLTFSFYLYNGGDVTNVANYTDLLGDALRQEDIINNLTSDATDKVLSAAQGKALKASISAIEALLASDTIALDTIQEIVDFIELNRDSLDNLTIAGIAGLQNALDNKVDKVAGKGLSQEDFTTAYKNKVDENTANKQSEILEAAAPFTLTDADYKNTFFINRTTTITVTIPSTGLRDNFVCFFHVIGTGQLNIQVDGGGASLQAPDGTLLIEAGKGMLEKKLTSGTFYASGDWSA